MLDPLSHNREGGKIAKFPTNTKVLESTTLESLAKEAYSILREWNTGNEPSTQFIMPWLLQVWRGFSHKWKPVTNHPLARDFEWSDFESAKN